MIATYHNHTTWSDGKAGVAELVAAAAALRVDELGISDHFTLIPGRRETPPPWSMPVERLAEYAEEVLLLHRDDRTHPVIRLGIEADWFPDLDFAQSLRQATEGIPLDYIIGSVHFVGEFAVDGNPQRWSKLSQDEIDEVHAQYWRFVRGMAETGGFDIAAHLDLPKKFGHVPREVPIDLIDEALEAIAAAGIVVELNTAGWHKPCREQYPSLDILRECRRRDIPVTISADAHQPDHLLRDFGRAADVLAEAGYDEIARFAAREVRFEPLVEAAPLRS